MSPRALQNAHFQKPTFSLDLAQAATALESLFFFRDIFPHGGSGRAGSFASTVAMGAEEAGSADDTMTKRLAELNADASTHGPVLSKAEKAQLRADGFLVRLLECYLSFSSSASAEL